MAEDKSELDSGLASANEPTDSFEEKMAKIQAILDEQKNEVEGRKSGGGVSDAPELTDAQLASDEADDVVKESEVDAAGAPEAVAADEAVEDDNAEAAESDVTALTALTDDAPSQQTTTPEQAANLLGASLSGGIAADEPVEAATADEASPDAPLSADSAAVEASTASEVATEAPDIESAPSAAATAADKKKSSKAGPVIAGVVVLAVLIGGGIGLAQHGRQAARPAASSASHHHAAASSSSSSASDSSQSSSASSSSSSSAPSSSSSSASSSAATPRQAQIGTVNHDGEKFPLDPHLTGSEPAFNFPENLKTPFIQMMQRRGAIHGDDYKLIPAQIINSQGFVNLYTGSGSYVATINVANGYYYMR